MLEEFFLAVGKALYIANGFEAKLRYVLRMAKLANRIQGGRRPRRVPLAARRALADIALWATDLRVLRRPHNARRFVPPGTHRTMTARSRVHQAARLAKEHHAIDQRPNWASVFVGRWPGAAHALSPIR